MKRLFIKISNFLKRNSKFHLLISGKSPKEFLFVMAFIVPCLSIVICYARIFYIVRKTALKTQDQTLNQRNAGSVRMTHNHATYATNNGQYQSSTPKSNPIPHTPNTQRQIAEASKPPSNGHRLSFLDEEDSGPRICREGSEKSTRSKKILKKNREEEMKFIDTSVESDLPPTLSSLQRKHVQQYSPIKEQQFSEPSSPLTVTVTHDHNTLDSISQNIESSNNHKTMDVTVDSALEVSMVSQDNQVAN